MAEFPSKFPSGMARKLENPAASATSGMDRRFPRKATKAEFPSKFQSGMGRRKVKFQCGMDRRVPERG